MPNINTENQLIFGGKQLSDFGVYLTNAGIYDSPERDVEKVEVPGKNGSLEFDNDRYKNVLVTYPVIIYTDFRRNLTGLTSFLLSQRGYKRIEDSFYPEYYRIGSFHTPFSPEVPADEKMGKFELEFDCKPQRWLKSGEEAITIQSEGMLLSPVIFDCRPLIRIYEAGSVTIGEKTITVSNLTGKSYADIDCELMDVYSGNVSLNKYTSGEFPVLSEGENEIKCTKKIDIMPRWWVL